MRLRVLLVIATALALAAVAPAQARRRDHVPPEFAGLRSAVTCIPGPMGGERTSSYRLTWEPARDNATAAGKIRYRIYQATAPGAEDLTKPTYTSAAGATTFDTPPLPAAKTFYFVVRARDRAGNEDSNTVEREGQNLCE